MTCDCDNGTLLAADIRDDQPCPNCRAGESVARYYANAGLDPWHPNYIEADDGDI